MLARCCMPPESSRGIFFSKPARPTSSSSRLTRPSYGLKSIFLISNGNWMFCQRLRQGSRLASWKIIPISGRGPVDRRAIEDDLPAGQVVQPGHAPEQRALAAAGWTENADELALRDLEREILQGVHRTRCRSCSAW